MSSGILSISTPRARIRASSFRGLNIARSIVRRSGSALRMRFRNATWRCLRLASFCSWKTAYRPVAPAKRAAASGEALLPAGPSHRVQQKNKAPEKRKYNAINALNKKHCESYPSSEIGTSFFVLRGDGRNFHPLSWARKTRQPIPVTNLRQASPESVTAPSDAEFTC